MYLYYSCIAQKRLVSITVLSLSSIIILWDMVWPSVYIVLKRGETTLKYRASGRLCSSNSNTESLYVTGFEKRDLIAQIMILRYRRF